MLGDEFLPIFVIDGKRRCLGSSASFALDCQPVDNVLVSNAITKGGLEAHFLAAQGGDGFVLMCGFKLHPLTKFSETVRLTTIILRFGCSMPRLAVEKVAALSSERI